MNKEAPKRFLVFSAHPDDLDFACSGTVAHLTAKRNEVVYCIVTNGEKGVHKVHQSKRSMVLMRENEQKNAARVVGVDHIIFLRQTDGDLEHTKDVRKLITKVIRQVRPQVVVAPDPANHLFDSFGRFHRDHRVTAEIVFDAIYPAVGSHGFYPELAKENILPHQIDEVWFYNADRPNLFIDITKTLKLKLRALSQHESQIKDAAELASNIRTRAREAGAPKKMLLAESFRRLSF